MSNQRVLGLAFVFFTAITAYVLAQAVGLALGAAGVNNTELFGGVTISWAVAVAISLGVAFFAWQNPGVQTYGQEVVGELKKVTWPTGPEIRAATAAVIIFSLVSSIVLFVLDFVSAKVMIEWIPAGIRWAQGLFA